MTPVTPVTASSPRRASARAGAGPLGPPLSPRAPPRPRRGSRPRSRCPCSSAGRGSAPAEAPASRPIATPPVRGRVLLPIPPRPRSPCPGVTHAVEPAPPEPPSAPTLRPLPGTASALGASGEEDPVRKAFRLLQKVRNVEGITKMWRRGAKEQTPRPGRRGASTERGPRGGQAPSHRKRTRQHHGVGVGTKQDPLPS